MQLGIRSSLREGWNDVRTGEFGIARPATDPAPGSTAGHATGPGAVPGTDGETLEDARDGADATNVDDVQTHGPPDEEAS